MLTAMIDFGGCRFSVHYYPHVQISDNTARKGTDSANQSIRLFITFPFDTETNVNLFTMKFTIKLAEAPFDNA